MRIEIRKPTHADIEAWLRAELHAVQDGVPNDKHPAWDSIQSLIVSRKLFMRYVEWFWGLPDNSINDDSSYSECAAHIVAHSYIVINDNRLCTEDVCADFVHVVSEYMLDNGANKSASTLSAVTSAVVRSLVCAGYGDACKAYLFRNKRPTIIALAFACVWLAIATIPLFAIILFVSGVIEPQTAFALMLIASALVFVGLVAPALRDMVPFLQVTLYDQGCNALRESLTLSCAKTLSSL